jgi:hypothetical protein
LSRFSSPTTAATGFDFLIEARRRVPIYRARVLSSRLRSFSPAPRRHCGFDFLLQPRRRAQILSSVVLMEDELFGGRCSVQSPSDSVLIFSDAESSRPIHFSTGFQFLTTSLIRLSMDLPSSSHGDFTHGKKLLFLIFGARVFGLQSPAR